MILFVCITFFYFPMRLFRGFIMSPFSRMLNDDTKTHKTHKNYLCEKCTFECINKKDYNRHLMTAKHKKMTNGDETPNKPPTTYNCLCGRSYAYRQGLDRHKKTCSLISNSIVITENQREQPSLMDIITQNKEIMDLLVLQNKEKTDTIKAQSDLLKEQSDTIRDLIPKIGSNNVITTTNNQFNMQTFLTEDCKDAMNFSEFVSTIMVSFKDLENQAEIGYVKGITKLFLDNLQGLGKHRRPIHCTDKKRKTLYIKENNEWDKEGSHDTLTKGIEEITRRTFVALMKEKTERPEEYADMDSEFSQNCVTIQGSIIPVAPRETSFSKVLSNISVQTTIACDEDTQGLLE